MIKCNNGIDPTPGELPSPPATLATPANAYSGGPQEITQIVRVKQIRNCKSGALTVLSDPVIKPRLNIAIDPNYPDPALTLIDFSSVSSDKILTSVVPGEEGWKTMFTNSVNSALYPLGCGFESCKFVK